MHIAAAAARGDDITSLNNHGLKYIALEQPGKQLVPDIAPDADKMASRGHNHPVFHVSFALLVSFRILMLTQ